MGDNAGVQQYQCNGGQNQQWIVAVGAAGNVRLIARHSGKALTVETSGGDASVGKVTQTTARAPAPTSSSRSRDRRRPRPPPATPERVAARARRDARRARRPPPLSAAKKP